MKKSNGLLILCTILFLLIILCFFSANAIESANKAINLCLYTIIPSLLPIMILVTLIVKLNLYCVVPYNFILPFLFLISLVAGFPVGAKLLNDCVCNKILSKNNAKKLLPSFINAGPGFIIGTIGIKILNNQKLGVILLISKITTSLILFFFAGGFKIKIRKTGTTKRFLEAFNESVIMAIKNVAIISTLIILFTVITDLLINLINQKIAYVITLFFEISTAVLKNNNPFIICLLLSECGLCVYMQVYSNIRDFTCKFPLLFLYRTIHAILSITIFKILLKIYPVSVNAFSNINTNISSNQSYSIPVTIIILFSLIALLLSIGKKSSGKLEKDLI